jgi:hypothetical protein
MGSSQTFRKSAAILNKKAGRSKMLARTASRFGGRKNLAPTRTTLRLRKKICRAMAAPSLKNFSMDLIRPKKLTGAIRKTM